MNKYYDMHVHSNVSDGYKSVNEIIKEAKEYGLAGLAFAEHDTFKISVQDAKELSRESGIEIIPAVEVGFQLIKSEFENIYGEAVVYFFNEFDDRKLQELLGTNKSFRKARMREMIRLVNNKFNSSLKLEDICKFTGKDDILSKHHLKKAIYEFGIGGVKSMSEASKIISEETEDSCYVEKTGVKIDEVLDVACDAGGVVSLAHPGILASKYKMHDQLFIMWIEGYFHGEKKISAIETNYPYFEKGKSYKITEKGEEEKNDFWSKVSTYFQLVPIGGKDYHQMPEEKTFDKKYATTERNFIRLKELAGIKG